MIDTPAASQIDDARKIWDYHQMGHQLRPCDVAIGLGSHDLSVADHAAALYHKGLFERLVFSGANSPTTQARFPRGEAVHYREHAMRLGVPDEAIMIEPEAANTGQNISLSRALLASADILPTTVMLISKPYMERRAYATTRLAWPGVEPICTSAPLELEAYIDSIGDARLVLDMLVGDLQRVIEYPKQGFAIEQDVPEPVREAYQRLTDAGYTSRLMS
ncbi:YdcF family protein [Nocardioides sp. NPDC051685]|uniref:YdcF family protein n=1 Tax=Nocardioides sp. NPDC051685 TaxID=3364334 RepID=UPI00379B07C9